MDSIRIDIGSGRAKLAGYLTLDNDPSVGADLTEDIEADVLLPDYHGRVDEIRAHHILEHIQPWNKVKVMANLYALLKPGGRLDIEVPLAGTEQYYQDPTHFCAWVAASFWYFTRGNRFGEAFARRYSRYPVPLFDASPATLTDGWKLNITLIKPF